MEPSDRDEILASAAERSQGLADSQSA